MAVRPCWGFHPPLERLCLSRVRFRSKTNSVNVQRANLGDPSFTPGLDEYQAEMLNETTAARTRSKINDMHTLNVSAYDPSGLESLVT